MKKIKWLIGIMCLTCLTLVIFSQPLMKVGAAVNFDTGITHYQVLADGTKKDIYTFKNDIDEILEKEEIELKNKDYISTKVLDKKTKIQVIRAHEKTIEEKETLPYERVVKKDNEIEKGVTKVSQPGQFGQKVIQYGVIYENGKEKERYKKNEEVIKESQNEIVLEGQKEKVLEQKAEPKRGSMVMASRSAPPAKRVLTMNATAYTHTGNRTATGTYPARGTIAVDPNVIPLGTKVFVEGYGNAVAADTGGVIKGNIIDVFLDSKGACRQWGRKTVKVHILN